MRVGLVIEQFDPCRGGGEQWTAQLAAQLLARGHEVHVVARRFGRGIDHLPIIPHRLEGADSRLGFAEAAQQMLETLPLDVIHDTGAGWYCDVFQPHTGSRAAAAEQNLLLLPPWMRSLKRVVSRGLPRYRQFDALSARQYADDGRTVLALSRRVVGDFHRFHGVQAERTRLIYNGVDTTRFSPEHRARYREPIRRRLGLDPRTVLLLIVAHNFRLKGVPMLLRAMARLTHQRHPVHLAVVGGRHFRRQRWAARRLGVSKRVTFVGSIDDPTPYYAAADIYVQPTFYDPCSLVVLEALASGLPVVTSRFNGAGELLVEGREGYLLSDPSSVDEFVGQVEVLFDPALRKRMGEAARRLALAHSLQRNVDQVLAVYEDVLRDRRPRRAAARSAFRPFVVRKTGVEKRACRVPKDEKSPSCLDKVA